MRNWRFWDWVGYVSLFIAAVGIAADAALKSSPAISSKMPEFFSSELWAFTPLAFVLLASAIMVLKELGVFGKRGNPLEWDSWPPKWNDPLRAIAHQKYENEKVELDGKHFIECTFNNVTFSYEGRQRTSFTKCEVTGSGAPKMVTHNPGISQVVITMGTLGMLSGSLNASVQKKDTPR